MFRDISLDLKRLALGKKFDASRKAGAGPEIKLGGATVGNCHSITGATGQQVIPD